MEKQVVRAGVPETGGPFNLCVRYGDMLYVSGLPPFEEEYSAKLRAARAKGQPMPPFPDLPFEQQVRTVMDHLKALVEAAGSNMDCLLKVIVWLKDQRQQEQFDRIYRGYFSRRSAAGTHPHAGRPHADGLRAGGGSDRLRALTIVIDLSRNSCFSQGAADDRPRTSARRHGNSAVARYRVNGGPCNYP